MRLRHFEELAPICPRCLGVDARQSPVSLSHAVRRTASDVLEGLLACTDPDCLLEFPIIDGVPILVSDVRAYVAGALPSLLRRLDLSPLLESVVGDCAGPGSPFDTERQHLSIYAWDHYGGHDPEEAVGGPQPGGAAHCLAEGLALIEKTPSPPVLDLGTAVGGNAFAVAGRTDGLVLGCDLSFPMVRLARRVVETGEVDYSRRRVGVVYDRRCFPVSLEGQERVDFWVFDALLPPFRPGQFGFVMAVNLIDCLANPAALPDVIVRLLRPGGTAVLTTPFDWSTAATPVEGWIGGHSQRGPTAGASEPLLDALLTPGAHPASVNDLQLLGSRDDITWTVRLHDRAVMSYRVRAVGLCRT